MSPRSALRCREKACRLRIRLFRSIGGDWRPFNTAAVDGRTHVGATAYPVEGTRYWRTRDLIEDLMVRHRYSEAEAQDEVYDMPWYVAHTCLKADDA